MSVDLLELCCSVTSGILKTSEVNVLSPPANITKLGTMLFLAIVTPGFSFFFFFSDSHHPSAPRLQLGPDPDAYHQSDKSSPPPSAGLVRQPIGDPPSRAGPVDSSERALSFEQQAVQASRYHPADGSPGSSRCAEQPVPSLE